MDGQGCCSGLLSSQYSGDGRGRGGGDGGGCGEYGYYSSGVVVAVTAVVIVHC